MLNIAWFRQQDKEQRDKKVIPCIFETFILF